MSADAAAPQARYRVLRGIVHHPGGVARPGDIIPLPPQDGDPLCAGPIPVLAQVLDQPPPPTAPPGIVDLQSTSSAAQAIEAVEPESEQPPKRRRKANP